MASPAAGCQLTTVQPSSFAAPPPTNGAAPATWTPPPSRYMMPLARALRPVFWLVPVASSSSRFGSFWKAR